MSDWKEAYDPQGRVYYYNSHGQTTWERPANIDRTETLPSGWKTATANDGAIYYYNEQTGETSWKIPIINNEKSDTEISTSVEVPNIDSLVSSNEKYTNKSKILHSITRVKSEAESMFIQMLDDNQVDSTWSFDRIISELSCKDPRYWCVDDDPLWKQQMFEKYLTNRTEDQLLKEHLAVNKFKDAFTSFLKSRSEIKYYTRWQTVKRLISNNPIYKHSVVSEKVKRETFEEYVNDLSKVYYENIQSMRKQAFVELDAYLREIISDKTKIISWTELSKQYLFENSRFAANKNFNYLTKYDILNVYMKLVETFTKEYEVSVLKAHEKCYRTDRIARDQFKELLHTFKPKIRCMTTWSDIYSHIKNMPSFLNILGRNGSSALDLFLDEVDEHKLIIKALCSVAQQVLIDMKFQFSENSEAKIQIIEIIKNSDRFSEIDDIDLGIISNQLYANHENKLLKEREREEYLEKQKKQYFNMMLHRLYGLGNSVKPATWDEAKPNLAKYPEYHSFKDDETTMKEMFENFDPTLFASTQQTSHATRKRTLATTIELDY